MSASNKRLENITWIQGTIWIHTKKQCSFIICCFPNKMFPKKSQPFQSLHQWKSSCGFCFGRPVLDPCNDRIGLLWRRQGRWRSTTKTTQAITIGGRTRRGPAALLPYLLFFGEVKNPKSRGKKKHATKNRTPTSLEMTLPFSTCPHLGGFGSQTIWPPCATNAGFTIGSSHRSPPNSVAPPKTSRVFEGFERWNGDFWALFQLLEKENEILKLQFWKIHVRIQQENSHDLGIRRAYI